MRIDLLGVIEGVLLLGMAASMYGGLNGGGAEDWARAAFGIAAAGYVRAHRCPVAVLEIQERPDAG